MPAIATPCTKVCTLDRAAATCLGCGRTVGEIAAWSRMSDAERAHVMAELPARRAARAAGAGAA